MAKMSKKTIVIAGLILAGIIVAAVCAAGAGGDREMSILDRLFNREREQTTDLTEYVEAVTGVQINDVSIEESGHVELSSDEEYAYICLKLDEGGTAVISERMDEAGKMQIKEAIPVPGYNGNEQARKLKEETIIARYSLFADGKGAARTRSMELYLTKDENGEEYLYLFG